MRQKDLFGRVIPPLRESALLSAVMDLLAVHPRVVWAQRMNSGAMIREYTRKDGSQGRAFVRFGFPGCPDILGMLKPSTQNPVGAFLAIEVKRQGERATPEQIAFLDLVARHGGASGLAYDVEDVLKIIEAASGE